MLGDADRQVLRESLQKNGQRDDIVLFKGLILEGRNREREMRDLGLEPSYTDYDPLVHGQDPFQFVWDKNFVRRHLTASQRAAVIVERNRILSGKGATTEDIKAAAVEMHVAPSTVHAAARIANEDPGLFEEVKAGTKTVNAAATELHHEGKGTDHTPAPAAKTATEKTGGASLGAPSTPAKKKTAGSGTPAKKKTATPPEPDKDADAMAALRKENLETVKHLHGDEFGAAFKKGAVLKSLKELNAFVKCNDNEQTLIVPYVVQGWEVGRALKFVVKSIDLKDPIQDLIFRFNATGKKSETFKIGGHSITIKKAE